MQDSTKKQNGIQILRAVMLVMVMMSHFIGLLPFDNGLNNTPLRLLWSGNCAVMGFFILSGYNYKRSFDKKTGGLEIVELAVLRLIRLVPITAISICFANVLKAIYRSQAVKNWPISEWGNSFWEAPNSISDYFSITSVNPSLWTMSIEIKYVILIVLILLIDRWARRFKAYKLIQGLILLCLLGIACICNLIYLYVFYVGILIFSYCVEKKYTLKQNILMMVPGIVLLYVGHFFPEGTIYRNSIFCLGWTLIILCIKDVVPHNKVHMLLARLGDYSFYIYLVHFPILLVIRGLSSVNWLLFYAVYIILSVCAGVIFSLLDKHMSGWMKSRVIMIFDFFSK